MLLQDQAQAIAVARDANKYLNDRAPWQEIKTDRARAATTLYVALRAVDSLKILLFPFLPFSAQSLHEQLGYDDNLLGEFDTPTFHEDSGAHEALVYRDLGVGDRWQPSALRPGQKLREPKPLFKKLDVKIVEEEKERLGK